MLCQMFKTNINYLKKVLVGMLIFLLSFAYMPTIVIAQPNTQRVIVQFKNNVAKDNYQKKVRIQSIGSSTIHEYKNLPVTAINATNSYIKDLENDPNVLSVEPDHQMSANSYLESNNTPQNINIQNAWKSNYTGKGVKVAVIDSGIDTTHPALKVAGGVSFVGNSYEDDNGHGTHVAGIIGANNDYISGVAPDVELYAVKALDKNLVCWSSDIIAGIDWSITNKMDIINLSLGFGYDETPLKKVIDKAYENGILIVAATGNKGNTSIDKSESDVDYPARYNSVIAVSAVDKNNNIAELSSTGSEVEIAAPGIDILSTMIKNDNLSPYLSAHGQIYASLSGTSMATPFVTGALAILKQEHPDYTNIELRNLLDTQAKDLGIKGRDPYYGFGLVQVSKHSPNEISVNRLAGQDRYETAVKISEQGWESSDNVVLTSGENFPDALVGVPLAYKLDAPILLTSKDNLPDTTIKEITRLKVKNVTILGGTGVISENIKSTLIQQGIKVQRISGQDRYETSQKVAQQLGNYDKAIIAYGENYPDALSIASYASKNGIPILLTETNVLSNSIKDALNNVTNTIVVGGNGVIDDSVYSQLPNRTRIFGKDRFETNNAVFEKLNPDTTKVYIATSNNFADSLSGSVLVAKNSGQIVLVDQYITSNLYSNIVKKSISNYEILGGYGAVNSDMERLLKAS